MHIKRIVAVNWCQHKRLDITLGPGLNGVIGRNGRGKSNFLDAIRFAFTGESVNPGGKADNLRWGTKKGWVTVEVRIADTDYAITRHIKTAKVEMTWSDDTGGEQKIEKVGELQDKITELTGAGPRALLDAVFVPQGKIDSVLYQRSSERLKDFQRIFGLEVLADAYRYLGEETNRHHVTPGLVESLKEASDHLTAAESEASASKAEVDELTGFIAEAAWCEDILRREVQAQQHAQALQNAQARVDAAEAAYKEAEDVLTPISEAAAAQDTSELERRLDELSQRCSALTTADSEFRRAEGLRAQLAAAEKELAEAPEFDGVPPTPEDLQAAEAAVQQAQALASGRRDKVPSEIKAEQALQSAQARRDGLGRTSPVNEDAEVAELTAQIEHIRREVGGFESGVCPTCGQEVKGGPDAIAAKMAEAGKLSDRRDEVCTRITAQWESEVAAADKDLAAAQATLAEIQQKARDFFNTKYTEALEHRNFVAETLKWIENTSYRRKQIEDQIAALRTSLDGAPTAAPTPADVEAADAERAAARQALQEAQEIAQAKRDAEVAVQYARKAYDDAKSALGALGDELDAPSPAEVAEAKETAEKVSQWRQSLGEADRRLRAAEVGVATRRSDVDRLTKQLEEEARWRSWLEIVRTVRDAMHPSKLPAVVMREYGKILNARIEWYLSRWQAPFRVWLDEDIAFKAIKPDEEDSEVLTEMDAARLSGGERIVGAVSFRLAMSDTFASEAGLVVLDEPSNYLDKQNIQHLQEVLLELRSLAAQSDRQVIVVTHEAALVGFFDHTVTIGDEAVLTD